MFANLAAQMAMYGVMSALFTNPGALGFANPMQNIGKAGFGGGWLFGGPSAPTYVPHRLGGVIGNGRIVPMANGAILEGNTYFPMADGNIGLAGEAGPELGFFPLKREKGRLGIEASGQQPVINVPPATIKIVYVRNQKEAILETMMSDEGQQAIVLANR
jgi:phage-related minor tail protein